MALQRRNGTKTRMLPKQSWSQEEEQRHLGRGPPALGGPYGQTAGPLPSLTCWSLEGCQAKSFEGPGSPEILRSTQASPKAEARRSAGQATPDHLPSVPAALSRAGQAAALRLGLVGKATTTTVTANKEKGFHQVGRPRAPGAKSRSAWGSPASRGFPHLCQAQEHRRGSVPLSK